MREIGRLKKRIADAITSIRDKTNSLTVADLKLLLFRTASTLIFLEEVKRQWLPSNVGKLTRNFSGTMI